MGWITEDLIMRRRMSAVGLAVAAVLVASLSCAGSSQQEAPKIEPKADQYLKAMSSYLAGLKTYSFQVEEFIRRRAGRRSENSAQQPAAHFR